MMTSRPSSAGDEPPKLRAALAYAKRMWPVAPAHTIGANGVCSCGGGTSFRKCSPGKHPRTAHGLDDATTDEAQIRAWWSQWPDANILVRTGMVADRCLVVLDIDPKHDGDESLSALEAKHGALPPTPRTITGSGGAHFWFWSSEAIRNTSGAIARGIDTRGVGGYVIVAPSDHETGAVYQWDAGAHPDDVPLAEFPSWLARLLAKRSGAAAAHAPVANAFIEGGRNSALASLAGTMRSRGFEADSIEAALMLENERKCRPPLDPREVATIARSVARYAPTDEPDGSSGVRLRALRLTDVVERWREAGPVVRVPTGWQSFDDAARGGLAFGRRTFLVGAPNAGKTAAATVLAHRMWRAGMEIGILAVDEEPDDIAARFAQMAGFSLDNTESGDESVLRQIGDALKEDGVHLYDHAWSIESAAQHLAEAAKASGRRPVFVVDSVQTARCAEAMKADQPRLVVAANVRALKAVTSTYKLLLIATSEMARAGYGNAESAKNFNDMAAGKESGDIEYAAAVQMVFRSVKDAPDKISVSVPKLKRGSRVEFFLRLNRASHGLVECDAPTDSGLAESARSAKLVAATRLDANVVRDIILRAPGIGVRELYSVARGKGLTRPAVDSAMALLGDEVGRRDAARNKVELFIRIEPAC